MSLPRCKNYYIAGPMTGIPQFNFPAFDTAAASLRAAGYKVTSPVELDKQASRVAALSNATGDPTAYETDTGETWGDLLSRDVKLIADEVDGVIVLDGWEKSRGARLEAFVARTCDLPVYSYEKWLADETLGSPVLPGHEVDGRKLRKAFRSVVPLPEPPSLTMPVVPPAELDLMRASTTFDSRYGTSEVKAFPVARPDTDLSADDEKFVKLSERLKEYDLKGEVRITSETGGEKGRKPQRMDLLPPEALLALSEVYGMGAEKYDDHNYLKGYDWSLSFGALLRHVMAAEKGEWLDDESGLPHVMHAAWHCFALFLFEKHGLGTDDRLSSTVEGMKS